MQTVNELLDAVKTTKGITSDYKLAHYLDVVPSCVKHWRHGRALPDELACEKIAAALGIDADVLIAEMNARRTKNPASKATWSRIALRLQAGSANVVFLMIVAAAASITTTFSPNAEATALSPQQLRQEQAVCIMLSSAITKLFYRLKRAARRLLLGGSSPLPCLAAG